MVSDPEPLQAIGMFRGQRSVMQADAYRMNRTDLFESEGGMAGIRLQQGEVLICQFPNGIGEPVVCVPEIRVS